MLLVLLVRASSLVMKNACGNSPTAARRVKNQVSPQLNRYVFFIFLCLKIIFFFAAPLHITNNNSFSNHAPQIVIYLQLKSLGELMINNRMHTFIHFCFFLVLVLVLDPHKCLYLHVIGINWNGILGLSICTKSYYKQNPCR